ncbi:TPA: hypothetical protein ACHXFN_005427, partial [Escherichia coli]
EGAKNGFIESQIPGRADTPNQGVSCRQEPRQPPAKPDRTELTAIQVVGGRRPSMLQQRQVNNSSIVMMGYCFF